MTDLCFLLLLPSLLALGIPKKKKMKGELGQRRICGLKLMIAIKPCTFASTVSVKAHRFVQRAVPL